MYNAAIITLSDKGYEGKRKDESKEVIEKILIENNFTVSSYDLIPDDKEMLKKILITLCDEKKVPLILTTGGTGFSKRDITPDVTKEVIEKEALGIAEAMRVNSLKITKRAMLSRAAAGIRNTTLIVNLPGSPKAVYENLSYIIDELHHGLQVLLDDTQECSR